MTKREMIKRKQALAREIHNIREDYAGVEKEDIPEDITQEITAMMTEMKGLRELLGNE